MTPLEELSHLIFQKGRRILVAQNPVDLKPLQGENSVYILQLPEEGHAAGGRAGGLGGDVSGKSTCFNTRKGPSAKASKLEVPRNLRNSDFPTTPPGRPWPRQAARRKSTQA